MTKYKIPGIELHYWYIYDYDQERQVIDDMTVSVLKLIEPFVTHLKSEQEFGAYLTYYQNSQNRTIFPKLERLEVSDTTFHDLQVWFGRDLSRFKELAVYYYQENISLFNYGALEKLTIYFHHRGSRDVIIRNLGTLKSITISQGTEGDDLDYFSLLAPIVPQLNVQIHTDGVTLLEPAIFSKLTQLRIEASEEVIYSFFSVTHPLLYKAIVMFPLSVPKNRHIVLAPQPSIRYFECSGSQRIDQLLGMLDSECVLKLTIGSLFKINLPIFTRLESLSLEDAFNYISNVPQKDVRDEYMHLEQTLQQSKLSSFSVLQNLSISTLIPYLSNLRNLRVHKLDAVSLPQVLSLPNLMVLYVTMMDMSFQCFTALVHQKCVPDVTIEKIERSNPYCDPRITEPFHIIAPMEHLTIKDERFHLGEGTNLPRGILWLLYVACTTKITTVNMTYPGWIRDTIPMINNTLRDVFGSLNADAQIIELFKKLLQEAIDESHLKVNEDDIPVIHRKLEVLLTQKKLP